MNINFNFLCCYWFLFRIFISICFKF